MPPADPTRRTFGEKQDQSPDKLLGGGHPGGQYRVPRHGLPDGRAGKGPIVIRAGGLCAGPRCPDGEAFRTYANQGTPLWNVQGFWARQRAPHPIAQAGETRSSTTGIPGQRRPDTKEATIPGALTRPTKPILRISGGPFPTT